MRLASYLLVGPRFTSSQVLAECQGQRVGEYEKTTGARPEPALFRSAPRSATFDLLNPRQGTSKCDMSHFCVVTSSQRSGDGCFPLDYVKSRARTLACRFRLFRASSDPYGRVIPGLNGGANQVEQKPDGGPPLKAITCIFASNEQDG